MEDQLQRFPHLRYAVRTDVGQKRTNNEDAFGVFPEVGVFCVSDGMGGGDDGEVASEASVSAIREFVQHHQPPSGHVYKIDSWVHGLRLAVNAASMWINLRARENGLKGCGATFVGICFDAVDPDEAVALHAGDSRLYRIRGKSIRQITKDHSAAELIGAKNEDDINPMFRGMILRAVGIQPTVELERTPLSVKQGDRILICSDGLSRMVPDRKLLEIVLGCNDLNDAVNSLIAAANDAGGIDNVTAMLIEVGKLPMPLPAVDLPESVLGHPLEVFRNVTPQGVKGSLGQNSDADSGVDFATCEGSGDDDGATATNTLASFSDTGSSSGRSLGAVTASGSFDSQSTAVFGDVASEDDTLTAAACPRLLNGKKWRRPIIVWGGLAFLMVVVVGIACFGYHKHAEAKRKEDAAIAEAARRKAEEARKAEAARKAAEERKAEEKRLAEERERNRKEAARREAERLAAEKKEREEKDKRARNLSEATAAAKVVADAYGEKGMEAGDRDRRVWKGRWNQVLEAAEYRALDSEIEVARLKRKDRDARALTIANAKLAATKIVDRYQDVSVPLDVVKGERTVWETMWRPQLPAEEFDRLDRLMAAAAAARPAPAPARSVDPGVADILSKARIYFEDEDEMNGLRLFAEAVRKGHVVGSEDLAMIEEGFGEFRRRNLAAQEQARTRPNSNYSEDKLKRELHEARECYNIIKERR